MLERRDVLGARNPEQEGRVSTATSTRIMRGVGVCFAFIIVRRSEWNSEGYIRYPLIR